MKKNLIIGVLTYFAVLTYFFGMASSWNGSAFVKLIDPKLVIIVLVFACFSVLPTLLLPIRLRRTLLFVSAGLVAVGALLILIHRIQPEISALTGYDVVNFGAAAIGIGIAFLGLDIARNLAGNPLFDTAGTLIDRTGVMRTTVSLDNAKTAVATVKTPW